MSRSIKIKDGTTGDMLFVCSSALAPDGSGSIVAKHVYDERTSLVFEPGETPPEDRDERLAAIRKRLLKEQEAAIKRALAYIGEHGMVAYKEAVS